MTTLVSSGPEWIADNTVTSCHICCKKFGVLTRRHHCRSCGKIFCSACCNRRVAIPEYGHHNAARVCAACFVARGGSLSDPILAADAIDRPRRLTLKRSAQPTPTPSSSTTAPSSTALSPTISSSRPVTNAPNTTTKTTSSPPPSLPSSVSQPAFSSMNGMAIHARAISTVDNIAAQSLANRLTSNHNQTSIYTSSITSSSSGGVIYRFKTTSADLDIDWDRDSLMLDTDSAANSVSSSLSSSSAPLSPLPSPSAVSSPTSSSSNIIAVAVPTSPLVNSARVRIHQRRAPIIKPINIGEPSNTPAPISDGNTTSTTKAGTSSSSNRHSPDDRADDGPHQVLRLSAPSSAAAVEQARRESVKLQRAMIQAAARAQQHDGSVTSKHKGAPTHRRTDGHGGHGEETLSSSLLEAVGDHMFAFETDTPADLLASNPPSTSTTAAAVPRIVLTPATTPSTSTVTTASSSLVSPKSSLSTAGTLSPPSSATSQRVSVSLLSAALASSSSSSSASSSSLASSNSMASTNATGAPSSVSSPIKNTSQLQSQSSAVGVGTTSRLSGLASDDMMDMMMDDMSGASMTRNRGGAMLVSTPLSSSATFNMSSSILLSSPRQSIGASTFSPPPPPSSPATPSLQPSSSSSNLGIASSSTTSSSPTTNASNSNVNSNGNQPVPIGSIGRTSSVSSLLNIFRRKGSTSQSSSNLLLSNGIHRVSMSSATPSSTTSAPIIAASVPAYSNGYGTSMASVSSMDDLGWEDSEPLSTSYAPTPSLANNHMSNSKSGHTINNNNNNNTKDIANTTNTNTNSNGVISKNGVTPSVGHHRRTGSTVRNHGNDIASLAAMFNNNGSNSSNGNSGNNVNNNNNNASNSTNVSNNSVSYNYQYTSNPTNNNSANNGNGNGNASMLEVMDDIVYCSDEARRTDIFADMAIRIDPPLYGITGVTPSLLNAQLEHWRRSSLRM